MKTVDSSGAPGDPAVRADSAPANDLPPGAPDAPANRRLIAALLAAWTGITFVIAYFARELQFHVLGWPFSFWVAAQGGVLVYVAITWVYARRMARLERRQD
jgi:putative solute:sodium symporter small subunit